jgi:hypothetical protein
MRKRNTLWAENLQDPSSLVNIIFSFYAEFTKLSDAQSENHAEDCGENANADLRF